MALAVVGSSSIKSTRIGKNPSLKPLHPRSSTRETGEATVFINHKKNELKRLIWR
jgi:hypothetical protein